MFEILAQTGTGLAIGGGGFAGAALVALLVRRTGNKVLNHVDDLEIHVRPGNGYITKEMCLERSENLEEQLRTHRNNITAIHKRIDVVINAQEDGTAKILAAIDQKSADK